MPFSWNTAGVSGLPDPVRDARFYEGAAGRRLVAFLIDFVVVALGGSAVALVVGVATLGLGLLIFPLVVATVGFFYRWITLSQASATWGMRATGIEIRRFDGERLDPAAALIHTAGFHIVFLFVLPQVVSAAMMASAPYGRGLHDLVLGTAAINRPA